MVWSEGKTMALIELVGFNYHQLFLLKRTGDPFARAQAELTWMRITDELNRRFPGEFHSQSKVQNKWKNMKQAAVQYNTCRSTSGLANMVPTNTIFDLVLQAGQGMRRARTTPAASSSFLDNTTVATIQHESMDMLAASLPASSSQNGDSGTGEAMSTADWVDSRFDIAQIAAYASAAGTSESPHLLPHHNHHPPFINGGAYSGGGDIISLNRSTTGSNTVDDDAPHTADTLENHSLSAASGNGMRNEVAVISVEVKNECPLIAEQLTGSGGGVAQMAMQNGPTTSGGVERGIATSTDSFQQQQQINHVRASSSNDGCNGGGISSRVLNDVEEILSRCERRAKRRRLLLEARVRAGLSQGCRLERLSEHGGNSRWLPRSSGPDGIAYDSGGGDVNGTNRRDFDMEDQLLQRRLLEMQVENAGKLGKLLDNAADFFAKGCDLIRIFAHKHGTEGDSDRGEDG